MSRAQLRPVPDFHPSEEDLSREQRMEALLIQFRAATQRAERIRLWREYVQLHNTRSARMVAWLEKKRNLYRA